MNEFIGKVKYFDSLTNKYIEIPVSIELETFIKRSYWREDMQDRRYHARILDIDEVHLEETSIYNDQNAAIDRIIKEFEKARVIDSIEKLEEKYKQLIRLIYFEEVTLTKAAEEFGVSVSYVSRMLKKVRNQLKEDLKDLE